MRKLLAVGLATALGASTLAAQYERRYEVGLFASFTKYDQAFGLDNKIGGGVRFAYALGPTLSLEVEALFQPPYNIPPSTEIEPVIVISTDGSSSATNPSDTTQPALQ